MGIKMFLNNGLIRIITRTTINYNKHNWLYRFPVWVRETQNKDFKWVMVSFRFWIDSDALVKYGCNSTSLTNWRLTSVFTCVCVCVCVFVCTGDHPLQTSYSVCRQQEGDGGVDGSSAQRPEQTELWGLCYSSKTSVASESQYELLTVWFCLSQSTQYSMDHFSGMHNWYACSHARPTYCNVCREALSGVTSHGLSCEGTRSTYSTHSTHTQYNLYIQ